MTHNKKLRNLLITTLSLLLTCSSVNVNVFAENGGFNPSSN